MPGPKVGAETLAQAALRVPPEVVLQCVAGHCYSNFQSSFFLFFFSVFYFWHTLGKLPRVKYCFPQYFCRKCNKCWIFLGSKIRQSKFQERKISNFECFLRDKTHKSENNVIWLKMFLNLMILRNVPSFLWVCGTLGINRKLPTFIFQGA